MRRCLRAHAASAACRFTVSQQLQAGHLPLQTGYCIWLIKVNLAAIQAHQMGITNWPIQQQGEAQRAGHPYVINVNGKAGLDSRQQYLNLCHSWQRTDSRPPLPWKTGSKWDDVME